jgi:hypothetical protein
MYRSTFSRPWHQLGVSGQLHAPGNIVLLTIIILDMAKMTNSIIITNFVQTLIPNCWFEIVFPTYFGIEIF